MFEKSRLAMRSPQIRSLLTGLYYSSGTLPSLIRPATLLIGLSQCPTEDVYCR